MKLLIIFFLLCGNAFANCVHIEQETEVAIFHNINEANAFAAEKHGQVYPSEDSQTFTVLYPVTLAVSNLVDCETSQ